jgi:hypothetical protein
VQVLVENEKLNASGINYVPGELEFIGNDTLIFRPLRGTRIVNQNGRWPTGRTRFVLLARGDKGEQGARQPITRASDSKPLDGEAVVPAGVLSGDGTPGGDFKLAFITEVRG